MRLSYNVMRNLKKEEEIDGLNQREEQIDENEKISVKYESKNMSGLNNNTNPLQVGKDDINLNNRKVVLNFGEKGDDIDDQQQIKSGPDSG